MDRSVVRDFTAEERQFIAQMDHCIETCPKSGLGYLRKATRTVETLLRSYNYITPDQGEVLIRLHQTEKRGQIYGAYVVLNKPDLVGELRSANGIKPMKNRLNNILAKSRTHKQRNADANKKESWDRLVQKAVDTPILQADFGQIVKLKVYTFGKKRTRDTEPYKSERGHWLVLTRCLPPLGLSNDGKLFLWDSDPLATQRPTEHTPHVDDEQCTTDLTDRTEALNTHTIDHNSPPSSPDDASVEADYKLNDHSISEVTSKSDDEGENLVDEIDESTDCEIAHEGAEPYVEDSISSEFLVFSSPEESLAESPPLLSARTNLFDFKYLSEPWSSHAQGDCDWPASAEGNEHANGGVGKSESECSRDEASHRDHFPPLKNYTPPPHNGSMNLSLRKRSRDSWPTETPQEFPREKRKRLFNDEESGSLPRGVGERDHVTIRRWTFGH